MKLESRRRKREEKEFKDDSYTETTSNNTNYPSWLKVSNK